MERVGSKQTTADPCVYVRIAGELSIVAVYVDDLILICETQDKMIKIKESLSMRFKMKD